MGSNFGLRRVATTAAVVTSVMAAAACASSGRTGAASGTSLDLDTVTAAQAVKTSAQAAAAAHTVHVHATTSGQNFTQTLDGAKRTDRFQQDVLVDSLVTGSPDHVHGEIRGDGKTVYLDDPGLPSGDRLGKTWVEFDLAHPPSAATGSPGAELFAKLAVIYAHDDPGQGALYLLAFPDLHRVGVETKDGRRALHVAGTATPDTLSAAPPDGSGLTQDYLDFRRGQAKDASTTKISFDLWIGADGLPIASGETDSAGDVNTVADLTMSQWGVVFPVPVPPAADVYVPPSR